MNIDEILKIEDATKKVIALHTYCAQKDDSKMSKAEKVVYAVEEFENTAMQEGLEKYVENVSDDESKMAIEGLKEIGATKSLDLLLKAIAAKGNIEELESLTEEFIKYEDGIQDLVIKYTEINKEDFK